MSGIIDILTTALDRSVLITDPEYIVGEDESIKEFKNWVNNIQQGMTGAVALGQIGNGKTHFLRYTRRYYREEHGLVGIYIPDMFASGALVDSLNNIYTSFFYGPGNYNLKYYYERWVEFEKNEKDRIVELSNNNIVRYLLHANNKEEKELVLEYFSNKDLFPDDIKFMRSKFGAKKRFIKNENDFTKACGDALEFLQYITDKSILIFIDEVDKVYSYDAKKECITKVSYKILSAYRSLFDHINARNIKGLICVGATIEAWNVLSWQTAFERRFKDHKIKLKSPKTKEDIYKFVLKRLKEIEYFIIENENEILKERINKLSEENMKSWADIMSALKSPTEEKTINLYVNDPREEILDILNNSILPLGWDQIVNKSDILRNMYPKNQPTKILSSLVKDGKIQINVTKPLTYEAIDLNEDDLNE
ncbi:hypothetical protein KPL47_02315 [Clostridium estertheticum]|uniref:hypothetical protein n=1 Tax=Clostridium estertheticum TaxID=238834 RepID=UPI001C0C35AD|nr:hypothetical protein [Clostridium estertheticum]MBU3175197.1 hypothetical protein [Clostridium estertheticum]